MKRKIKDGIGLITLLLLLLIAPICSLAQDSQAKPGKNTESAQKADFAVIEHPELEPLIYALAGCESHHDNMAVNPNDLDNTPSYSTFQWKPDTWKLYVKKYDLFEWQGWEDADFTNNMYDTEMQTIVVRHMFVDPQVNLHHEFPDCSSPRHLNLQRNYAPKIEPSRIPVETKKG